MAEEGDGGNTAEVAAVRADGEAATPQLEEDGGARGTMPAEVGVLQPPPATDDGTQQAPQDAPRSRGGATVAQERPPTASATQAEWDRDRDTTVRAEYTMGADSTMVATQRGDAGAEGKGTGWQTPLTRRRAVYYAFETLPQIPTLLEAVHQLYLHEAGLPENPFFFLATQVAAFQEQEGLWAMSDPEVLDSCHHKELEIVDSARKLSKVHNFPHAWGLPHVLRNIDIEAMESIHLVLRTLPGSFNSAVKLDDERDDYVVSQLTSVQGPCILHSSSLPPLVLPPLLELRIDVQVVGSKLEEALEYFGEVLLDDLRQLDEQYHVVHRVVVEHPPLTEGISVSSLPTDMAVPKAAVRQEWTVDDLADGGTEFTFINAVKRAVVSRQRILIEVSIAADIQAVKGGGGVGVAGAMEAGLQRGVSYLETVAEYVFHFGEGIGPGRVVSYGALPLESLFCGVFFEQFSAQRYLSLFGAVPEPYIFSVVEPNKQRLHRFMVDAWNDGQRLTAYAYLLLAAQLEGVSKASDAHPLCRVALPALHRVLHSHAAKVSALARQARALQQVVLFEKNRRLQNALVLEQEAEAAAAASDDDSEDDEPDPERFAASETARQEHISKHFTLLQRQLAETLSSSAFIELQVIERRVAQLLAGVAVEDGLVPVEETSSDALRSVYELCDGVARSMGNSLSKRCHVLTVLIEDFARDLRTLQLGFGLPLTLKDGIDVDNKQLVVHEGAARVAKELTRACPANFATEATQLQYAVDTGLDTMLQELYLEIVSPPMPLNPYPIMMRHLLTKGFLLHIWPSLDEDLVSKLRNSISLAASPGFIYSARTSGKPAPLAMELSPQEQSKRREKLGPSMEVDDEGEEEEEEGVVYGLYSAVVMAEIHTALAWKTTLRALTRRRRWQQGAYQAEVLIALTGDVVFGNISNYDANLPPPTSDKNTSDTVTADHTTPSFSNEVKPQKGNSTDHPAASGPNVMTSNKRSLLERLRRRNPQKAAEEKVDALGTLQKGAPTLSTSAHSSRYTPSAFSAEESYAFWQSQLHMRVELVEVHLVDGPGRPDALHAFGQAVLLRLVDLHTQKQTAVHELVVGKEDVRRRWSMADIQRNRLTVIQALVRALQDASDNAITAEVSYSVLGGYVPLLIHFHMNFNESQTWYQKGLHWKAKQEEHAGAESNAEVSRGEAKWHLNAYAYLFLSRRDALDWMEMHIGFSDPSTPHYIAENAQALEQRSNAYKREGGVLNSHKSMLTRALMLQDFSLIVPLAHTVSSSAQILACLGHFNKMLQQLVLNSSIDDRLHIDSRIMQQTLLRYCTAVEKFALSESYCPLSGVPSLVNTVLTLLRQRVERGMRLSPSDVENLERVNDWTETLSRMAANAINEYLQEDGPYDD